jgi:hypothetical protein
VSTATGCTKPCCDKLCTCSLDDYDYSRIDDPKCPRHHPPPEAERRPDDASS